MGTSNACGRATGKPIRQSELRHLGCHDGLVFEFFEADGDESAACGGEVGR